MGRIGRYFHEAMGRTRPLYVCLCGGILWVSALTVRLTTTAPYVFLHGMVGQVSLPPTWLLEMLWQSFFLLAGVGWGYILGLKGSHPRRDAWRFRGSMYFLLSVMFALLWYRLLFGAWAVFLSWVCLPVSLVTGGVSAVCWWRIYRPIGGIMGAFAAWIFLLFSWQFVVIWHI